MKTWKLNVSIKVHEDWVSDGFNVDDRRIDYINELLGQLIPYATPSELVISTKVTKSPSEKEVNELQGYY